MADTLILDFTNVKDRGDFNPKHLPAGDYLGKIIKFHVGDSKNGNKQVTYTVQCMDSPSATYPYRCVVETADQLWKLRNLFIAAGVSVPKKKIKVDPGKIVNREIGITLDDNEYEGRVSSTITDVFPASDLPEDEEPIKNKVAGKKVKGSTEVVDDEEEEEEDLEELDLDDL